MAGVGDWLYPIDPLEQLRFSTRHGSRHLIFIRAAFVAGRWPESDIFVNLTIPSVYSHNVLSLCLDGRQAA